tara:strand:- start:159 stop:368 length:210 start_codon:yes stop_codon:yes gene_type:complete
VAPRVPVLILDAETVVTEIAGVWIFVVAWILVAETVVAPTTPPQMVVAEIVVALKLVTESAGVWILVAA